MARIPFFLLALSSVFYTASTFDIRGKIQWNDVCPNISELGRSKVILDDGKMYGGVTQDGTFTIPDVPSGTYIISVLSHDHAFEQLRIDVLDNHASIPEVRPYVSGTPLNPRSTISLPYPITLSPRQRNVYFVPKESFNLLGMFQNPMMLMMVFAGGMMLGMPYLMKNMDPEVLEDFKERQGKIHNIQNSLQSGDIKSGAFIAADGEPKAAASSVAASKSQPKNRKKKR